MAHYACIVQEGQGPQARRAELEEGLRRIGRELLGDAREGVEVQWIAVPPGFGFTAGKPSTSSVVARSVPVGFPDDEREAFMRRVSGLWQEVSGCSEQEIVVTALDGPLPV